MVINLIAAVSNNGAIGKNGATPWHLEEDMKHFRSLTMSHPVIMGRKTFESIGKPLEGRENIVLSRTSEHFEGAHAAKNAEMALAQAESTKAAECFIIGGEEIYRLFMDIADRLHITNVNTEVEGADAFFPQIDSNTWNLTEHGETLHDSKSGLDFCFMTYEKRR